MAQTQREKLDALINAMNLGGPMTIWSGYMQDLLDELCSKDKYSIAWAMSRIDVTGNAASAHSKISGAVDDDLTICGMKTTDDTDTIIKCADVTGELVTLTASANGAAAHAHKLMGIREGAVASHEIVAAG